ncbi:MAG: hypothetical protein M0002_03675 [Rhodospirillales bacterium]|nr:hypothetical protein [Rhodospirillales bacterium]
MLYEVLPGKLSFAERNLSETVLRLTDAAPADLAPVAAEHEPYVPVLARALAKWPAERFENATSFAAALAAARGADVETAATVVLAAGGLKPAAGLQSIRPRSAGSRRLSRGSWGRWRG